MVFQMNFQSKTILSGNIFLDLIQISIFCPTQLHTTENNIRQNAIIETVVGQEMKSTCLNKRYTTGSKIKS